MCYFLTIAVPAKHSDAARNMIPRGFDFIQTANSSIKSVLPSDYETFVLVSGGCSCGLFGQVTVQEHQSNADRLRNKGAKKGWSSTKIDRAIEQTNSAHWRRPPVLVGFRDDVVDILAKIAGNVGSFAIMVHFYQGDIDNEQISIGSSQRTVATRLRSIAPDVDSLLLVDAS
jgi:hypothetical protein